MSVLNDQLLYWSDRVQNNNDRVPCSLLLLALPFSLQDMVEARNHACLFLLYPALDRMIPMQNARQ